MTINANEKNKSNWFMIAGIGSAIGATACCVGPLLLLMLGVSGAWISNLTALEPYSPILSILAIGFIGFGMYRLKAREKQENCKDGSYCANPKSKKMNRIFMIVATVFTLTLLATPHIIPYVLGSAKAEEKVRSAEVILHLQNMTCNMCSITVRKSLMNLHGVENAKVTYKPQRASVIYNPKEVNLKALVKATTDAGYPSKTQIELMLKAVKIPVKNEDIISALEKVKGVTNVKVGLSPLKAVVVFDPFKVSLEDIKQHLSKSGYPTLIAGGS